ALRCMGARRRNCILDSGVHLLSATWWLRRAQRGGKPQGADESGGASDAAPGRILDASHSLCGSTFPPRGRGKRHKVRSGSNLLWVGRGGLLLAVSCEFSTQHFRSAVCREVP